MGVQIHDVMASAYFKTDEEIVSVLERLRNAAQEKNLHFNNILGGIALEIRRFTHYKWQMDEGEFYEKAYAASSHALLLLNKMIEPEFSDKIYEAVIEYADQAIEAVPTETSAPKM